MVQSGKEIRTEILIMSTLGKGFVILIFIGLPFGILEGMWSEPSLREFARSFDGSRSMWILLCIYYGIVASIVFLKFYPKKKIHK
jgi:hypothetical protein